MGYYIYTRESTARIKMENMDKALIAFKKWQDKNNRLGFTSVSSILNAKNLKELLEELRYDSKYDSESGDLLIIEFTGDKYGNELTIWQVLAPFVENDTYIEYKGEDGDVWRHIFKNGKCKEVHPKIVWEELQCPNID